MEGQWEALASCILNECVSGWGNYVHTSIVGSLWKKGPRQNTPGEQGCITEEAGERYVLDKHWQLPVHWHCVAGRACQQIPL